MPEFQLRGWVTQHHYNTPQFTTIMCIRPEHAEHDHAVLCDFIRSHPLGQFTTAIPYEGLSTIQTSQIPWVLEDVATDAPARLLGHVSRANPQAKALIAAAATAANEFLPEEVLIMFNAPIDHYVTPKFYTNTKPQTGKVVPTWNYAAVQVYGKVKVYNKGPDATAYLRSQLNKLTDTLEARHGNICPWRVTHAPDDYISQRMHGIVGVEIEVTRMEGRWKVSQERNDGDWQGVVQGLEAMGTKEGQEMARMIREKGVSRSHEAKR